MILEARSSPPWAAPGAHLASSVTWAHVTSHCRMLGLLRRKVTSDLQMTDSMITQMKQMNLKRTKEL